MFQHTQKVHVHKRYILPHNNTKKTTKIIIFWKKFLVTVLHVLKYTTVTHIAARTTGDVLRELKVIFGLYGSNGFKVQEI